MRILVYLLIGFVLLIGIAVFWPPLEFKRAKAYCSSLVPTIEAYKAEHGVYPESLDGIVETNWLTPTSAKKGCFWGPSKAESICGYNSWTKDYPDVNDCNRTNTFYMAIQSQGWLPDCYQLSCDGKWYPQGS